MKKEQEDDADLSEDAFDLDDEVVRASLESGLDLREYSAKIDAQLKSANRVAVKDCIEQAENLADLHEKIVGCDRVYEVNFKLKSSTNLQFPHSGSRGQADGVLSGTGLYQHGHEASPGAVYRDQSAAAQPTAGARGAESVRGRHGRTACDDKVRISLRARR